MLGKIFGIIALLSVLTAIFTGRIEEVGLSVAGGANDAVKLIISLAGMICLWSGIIRVLKAAGLMEILSKVISPLLKILLPHTYKIKKQGEKLEKSGKLDNDAVSAFQSVSANIGANMLGIGNAATPLGIDAMKKLNDVKNKSQAKIFDSVTANGDMIMFAVINCASLQIIPTTLIALRSAAGSEKVFEIIPAVWLCSLATAIFAVAITKFLGFVWEKVFNRTNRNKNRTEITVKVPL